MLDLNYVRQQFPGLNTDWILMDNAGGSQIALPVLNRINEFLRTSHVQLGATYRTSDLATNRVAEAHQIMADHIGAADPGEVVMGSSTSLLMRTLSSSIGKFIPKGSEIIVTNCDHEANIGCWRELEQKGMVIKTWKINQETWTLELDDLRSLLSSKTRVVTLTHASNILGKINPIKEISQVVHEAGAWICVDAVAYAPHREIDVRCWDVDFYCFSFYKTYGPHYAMLYGKKDLLRQLPGTNHYFIGQDETTYKFQPGYVNFELAWGVTGLPEYLKDLATHHQFTSTNEVYEQMAHHEEEIATVLIDFLKTKKTVRFIGPNVADKSIRVPTVSFVVGKQDSEALVLETDKHKIGIRFGDFYAARLIDELGLRPQQGVVRVSMVHYNTLEEVERLVGVLEGLI